MLHSYRSPGIALFSPYNSPEGGKFTSITSLMSGRPDEASREVIKPHLSDHPAGEEPTSAPPKLGLLANTWYLAGTGLKHVTCQLPMYLTFIPHLTLSWTNYSDHKNMLPSVPDRSTYRLLISNLIEAAGNQEYVYKPWGLFSLPGSPVYRNP